MVNIVVTILIASPLENFPGVEGMDLLPCGIQKLALQKMSLFYHRGFETGLWLYSVPLVTSVSFCFSARTIVKESLQFCPSCFVKSIVVIIYNSLTVGSVLCLSPPAVGLRGTHLASPCTHCALSGYVVNCGTQLLLSLVSKSSE